MGIFRRTLVSIKQRFSKTIILVLTVFIIANVIGAAITIKEATANVELNMKERLGAYASLEFNPDYYNEPGYEFSEGDMIFSKNKAEEIGNSPFVRNYAYSLAMIVGSNDMKPNESEGIMNMRPSEGENANLFDFTIVADNNDEPAFARNGKIDLVSGIFPKSDDTNTIAISESVANDNRIKLNDEVNINYGVMDMYGDNMQMNSVNMAGKISNRFKVVGIYKASNIENLTEMERLTMEYEKNTIYTNLKSLSAIDKQASEILHNLYGGDIEKYLTSVMPTYVLNSVDDIDSFLEEVSDIVPKGFVLSTSKDSFENVASSVINMNLIANNVYIFGIIIAVIILALVIIITLRERKTEFGIYQALGESRFKTLSQIGLEVIIITIIATSLALFSSGKIANSISTKMIENQIASDNNQNNMGYVLIGGSAIDKPEITVEDVVENYSISIDSEFVATLYIVMIISSASSAAIAMLYMLRQKPREILL